MRRRHFPQEFLRRCALVEDCVRAVPPWRMPLDVWGGLIHGTQILHLWPDEDREFIHAVRWVREQQGHRGGLVAL